MRDSFDSWLAKQQYEYSRREAFFLRQALMPVRSSAGLMSAAKAIEWLAEHNTPVPLQTIRRQLEALVEGGLALATYQGGQAAAKASRLLEVLDGTDEEPSEGKVLAEADQLAWLELDIAYDINVATGSRLSQQDWRRRSAAVRHVQQTAQKILDADDPLGEWECFNEEHGVVARMAPEAPDDEVLAEG